MKNHCVCFECKSLFPESFIGKGGAIQRGLRTWCSEKCYSVSMLENLTRTQTFDMHTFGEGVEEGLNYEQDAFHHPNTSH